MPTFRENPAVVEAEQFYPDRKPWPKGVEENIHSISKLQYGWIFQTLDGGYTVNPGDWIITTAKGERRYCEASEFEATYELVEE